MTGVSQTTTGSGVCVGLATRITVQVGVAVAAVGAVDFTVTVANVGAVGAIGSGANDGSTDHGAAAAARVAVGAGIGVGSITGVAGDNVTLAAACATAEAEREIGVDGGGDANGLGVTGVAAGSTVGDAALEAEAWMAGTISVWVGAAGARSLGDDDPPPAAAPMRKPIAMLPAMARSTTIRRETARFCPIHVLEERGEHHSRRTAPDLDLAGRACIV